MVIVRDVLLACHLVGFALLLGGLLVQVREREPYVSDAMVVGTVLLAATGVVLAGSDIGAPHYTRSLVKLVVWLPVAVLVFVNRRWTSIPKGLWALLTALVCVDLGVATLWH